MPQHPFQYTLNLLKLALEQTPPFFPEDRKKEIVAKYEELSSNLEASQEGIEEVLIELGREKWPYRKAYEAMLETYTAGKEREYFLENLEESLRQKFMEFEGQGGKLKDIRGGRKLEQFFTSEDKFAINEAKVKAREKVLKEAEKIVLDKKDEYDKWVEKFRSEESEIIGNIGHLKRLSRDYPELAAEIKDKVRTIEEGFSIAERDVRLEDVVGALDYFKGVIAKKRES